MFNNQEFFRCRRCFYPSTKPDLEFSQEMICGACRFRDYEDSIDWDKRKDDFLRLAEEMKEKRNQGGYDCIIPVSGGKDSYFQTYLAKAVAGLNPLLVSFEPSYPTQIGINNLDAMRDEFNVDLIQLKKSSTYKKLARIGFDVVGDHEWPNHVGIYCWPIQMAVNFSVPYVFYGETRGIIGLGPWESLIEEREIPRADIEQFIGMNGMRLEDVTSYDEAIEKEHTLPYTYPPIEKIRQHNIRAFSLGYFFRWDFVENIKKIKKYGWSPSRKNKEGTFVNFEDLDCGFMQYHQYFKFIKYGYGRATDHAAHELRFNRMTKKEAFDLIVEHDLKMPQENFPELLKFLDISEEKFFETRDRFTNRSIFESSSGGALLTKWDGNLMPKQQWFASFEF
jgi:N-acetyl sugar amidotransferase